MNHARNWLLSVVVVLALCVDGWGCGAQSDDVYVEDDTCYRSAYELEGHYRCTPAGELQLLECSEWLTLRTCYAETCSPFQHNLGCNP